VLEVRALVKHFPAGGGEIVRVLDGISLEVASGELAALYGPSGEGKTTLLTIIAALLKPDSGSVCVNGRDITKLKPAQAARYRRNDLGYVGQVPDLMPGVSAIDNASLKLFGQRVAVAEAHRRAASLMDRLGLGARLHHPPDQLSAGQRQRVLIARALATDPKLVIADEPTGSLDRHRGAEVLSLLTEICQERNVAMLLATHDPSAAGYAQHVWHLRDGTLHDRAADALAAEEP
jgi:putative ABC transport system ATP-binding protein